MGKDKENLKYALNVKSKVIDDGERLQINLIFTIHDKPMAYIVLQMKLAFRSAVIAKTIKSKGEEPLTLEDGKYIMTTLAYFLHVNDISLMFKESSVDLQFKLLGLPEEDKQEFSEYVSSIYFDCKIGADFVGISRRALIEKAHLPFPLLTGMVTELAWTGPIEKYPTVKDMPIRELRRLKPFTFKKCSARTDKWERGFLIQQDLYRMKAIILHYKETSSISDTWIKEVLGIYEPRNDKEQFLINLLKEIQDECKGKIVLCEYSKYYSVRVSLPHDEERGLRITIKAPGLSTKAQSQNVLDLPEEDIRRILYSVGRISLCDRRI